MSLANGFITHQVKLKNIIISHRFSTDVTMFILADIREKLKLLYFCMNFVFVVLYLRS